MKYELELDFCRENEGKYTCEELRVLIFREFGTMITNANLNLYLNKYGIDFKRVLKADIRKKFERYEKLKEDKTACDAKYYADLKR
jgi:hypothetical protein